jgi:phosphoribosylamine--glycine ligase
MDKTGVLIVTKCLSGAAILDALERSSNHRLEFYVVAKQDNPYFIKRAKVRCIVQDLNLHAIARFAKRFASHISFGLTDTEDFVTAGGRDLVESETRIPMLCVSKKYAVERSKADQRLLFDKIFPGANPIHRIFDPKSFKGMDEARRQFRKTLGDIPAPVLKPDAPARGAGVGVWGSDFTRTIEAEEFFVNLLSKGRVVVEEKVEGEESSFHGFSDGRHFVPAPLTRDYKRSLEGDGGRLTGGMGSYRGSGFPLPFVADSDWEVLASREEMAFRKWKGKGSNPGLRGIVLYDAVMHCSDGFRILERNSRGGNTELINILTTMDDDFVDVCYRTLDGSLKGIRFGHKSSVVTCAVPLEYGTVGVTSQIRGEVDLSNVEALVYGSEGAVRCYPMDLEFKRGKVLMGKSRSVAVVGLGDDTEDAREESLKGCSVLKGPLRWRRDVASPSDIQRSRDHLRRLRSEARASPSV